MTTRTRGIPGRSRRALVAAVAATILGLTGCTSSSETGSESSASPPSATTTGEAPPPMTESPAAPPTTAGPPQTESSPSVSVDAKTPVPKAGRDGQPSTPTISADPVQPQQPVVYPDNVSLAIDDITFGTETDQGPGAFPGREYAVIAIAITNGSSAPINLDTAIVTVLDNTNNPVAQIFPSGLGLTDLAGNLTPGAATQASYAFAVPASSRSQVTVVVDFDAIHTSAVFHGAIG